jgi:GTP-dependent dephospho-CoA kinase
MKILPEELREALKEPFGKLVNEKQLLSLLKQKDKIISIGDIVTYTLITNNIIPQVCIIDYIHKRKQCAAEITQAIKGFAAKQIIVTNPPGTITDELWDTLELVLNKKEKKPVRIEIDGEEDLASLAAIYLAPLDATIIYGLPNKGVVVANATVDNKNKVKKILDRM